MKAKKFTLVLFVVFFVLVSFAIPGGVIAADCPCFSEKDVTRFASHPLQFTCLSSDYWTDVRGLVRGEYTASFSVSKNGGASGTTDKCSAIVYVGDPADPDVVIFGGWGESDPLTYDQFLECERLLYLNLPPDIQDCANLF